jgi:hypothetical protein
MNNFKAHSDGATTGKRPRWGQHYSSLKVDKVVSILVLTADIQQASKETNVAVRTINRWLQQDNEFREKLRLAKRELFEPGYSELRIEFPKTVRALVKMRDDTNISDAVRLGAMRTLMEYGKQVDMMDHYDGKLEQLEAKTINAVETGVITQDSETNDEWTSNTPDWKDQPQDWQQ